MCIPSCLGVEFVAHPQPQILALAVEELRVAELVRDLHRCMLLLLAVVLVVVVVAAVVVAVVVVVCVFCFIRDLQRVLETLLAVLSQAKAGQGLAAIIVIITITIIIIIIIIIVLVLLSIMIAIIITIKMIMMIIGPRSTPPGRSPGPDWP